MAGSEAAERDAAPEEILVRGEERHRPVRPAGVAPRDRACAAEVLCLEALMLQLDDDRLKPRGVELVAKRQPSRRPAR